MIDPRDWEKLKELFDRALTHDGAERERFVAEACAHDSGLKSQLLRLLAAHDGAGDFLSVPALACAQEEVPERRLFNPDQVVSGRFLIRRLIARGGMGDVYEAQDQVLGEKVALKDIWEDAARGLDLARIKTEVQSARRVTHANVCRTYDIALHDEPPVALVTMELLEGPTLSVRFPCWSRSIGRVRIRLWQSIRQD